MQVPEGVGWLVKEGYEECALSFWRLEQAWLVRLGKIAWVQVEGFIGSGVGVEIW